MSGAPNPRINQFRPQYRESPPPAPSHNLPPYTPVSVPPPTQTPRQPQVPTYYAQTSNASIPDKPKMVQLEVKSMYDICMLLETYEFLVITNQGVKPEGDERMLVFVALGMVNDKILVYFAHQGERVGVFEVDPFRRFMTALGLSSYYAHIPGGTETNKLEFIRYYKGCEKLLEESASLMIEEETDSERQLILDG